LFTRGQTLASRATTQTSWLVVAPVVEPPIPILLGVIRALQFFAMDGSDKALLDLKP
jgi:hypothetical protein